VKPFGTGDMVCIVGQVPAIDFVVQARWENGSKGSPKDVGPLLVITGHGLPSWADQGVPQGAYPPGSRLVPEKHCYDGRERHRERRAAARSKHRAHMKLLRKYGPTVGRLACGVAGTLFALLGLVLASR
jgi:hypothetical protein